MSGRVLCVVLAVLGVSCGSGPVDLPQLPPRGQLLEPTAHGPNRRPWANNFMLSLSQEYGRASFRHCRLDLVSYEERVRSTVVCSWNISPGHPVLPLTAEESMAPTAVTEFVDVVRLAGLYDGGHIGTDGTPNDGVFETLKLTGHRGTVVVVTSGNPSFAEDPSRRELLKRLKRIEERLIELGRQPLRTQ